MPELDQYNEIRFNNERMYLMCDPAHPLRDLSPVAFPLAIKAGIAYNIIQIPWSKDKNV